MPLVLIVDDERLQRDIIKAILESEAFETLTASSGTEALMLAEKYHPDVMLIDLKMEGMDGIELMEKVPSEPFKPSMILMTAHGTVASAVRAMKKGALDYLTKPLDKDGLMLAVERAARSAELTKENLRLKRELAGRFRMEGIVGKSPAMKKALDVTKKVSQAEVTVLITGESGTGKELVARAVHYNGPRSDRPFIALNCSAIPESLFESELFGYEPGAFTGASTRKEGLIEAADGGTLFLDEIGELPNPIQSKLLRVLQDKDVRRVGGRASRKVDVRFIAATNKNLEEEIGAGRFREDLFYRLAVVRIDLPPLRQRMEDLEELADFFVARYNRMYGKRVKGLDKAAKEAFAGYSWPGNIRQLSSVIERAVLLNDSGEITYADVEDEFRPKGPKAESDIEIPEGGLDFERLEHGLILKAMEKSGGIATKAAKLLGMSYKTFIYRLDKIKTEDKGR